MNHREINLRANSPESAITEVRYEIAGCRADGIDLLRINILFSKGEESDTKKIMSTVIKVLKEMKAGKGISFFATEASFKNSTTEASFLQNKYPHVFSSFGEKTDSEYIYVKL